MAPPKGMAVAAAFAGFEDVKAEAAIFFSELSLESFDGAVGSLSAESLAQQGMKIIKRDDPKKDGPKRLIIRAEQTANGKLIERWFVVDGTSDITALAAWQMPKAAAKAYPEKAVRAALASLSVRGKLTDAEMRGALPFELKDLGGFRIVRVLPGSTAILTDGPKDAPEPHDQAIIIITRSTNAPPPEAEREELVRRIFSGTRAAGSLVTERSGAIEFGGKPGHEIIAAGRDPESKQYLYANQFFQFGGKAMTRMLAIGPARDRISLEKRFPAVRDGLFEKPAR